MENKYKLTVFKDRFKTTGHIIEKTMGELYLGFKHKVKRTKDKYSEYMSADRDTKVVIKDVGGFIGGVTEGNRRVNGIKITRQLLSLDIDTDKPNVLEYLKRNIDFYCIVHSTHSHSPDENRYRVIAPLSREVNSDEYEALGRRIAYKIENAKTEQFQGLFDETTFQANRLMFFPSVSSDGEYVCELLNLDMMDETSTMIDVDLVLEEYLDKNDVFEWFKPEKKNNEQIGKSTLKKKNPLKAKGMVGAFNRTYSITQAIEKFLDDTYTKEKNGRYTYVDGDSYGGGIILNDDAIFYSHHGTDPANLYYRSAFDLVRIHKFGNFDKGITPEKELQDNIIEKTESFQKMVDFCRSIPEVVAHSDSNIALSQNIENQKEKIKNDFNVEEDKKEKEKTDKKDDSWVVQLDGLRSDLAKLDIILERDELIGSLFYYDTFRDNICFKRKPFWHRKFTEGIALGDKDMSHIRVHLDKVYSIKGEKKIDDAVVVESDKEHRNKVLDFFESLEWDGKARLEYFFHDFFKVKLNPFTRVAFKNWLIGAVSRIYDAGAPMDLLLIIKGKQGIGKSLFFKRLATLNFNNPSDHLYSDTKIDFDRAKDSYEQLEGVWIYEWKELAGMNMSEQESIKAFVDKTEDKFRRSYGRRNVEIKRRVAFGGSTNETTPLRDRTGNRRFLVMDANLDQHECYIKDSKNFTQEYRDQLIAEAIHLYKDGYDIFDWTEEQLRWWDRSNEDNLAENDILGSIGSYLEMKRPASWYSMSIQDMYSYMDNYDFQNNKSNSSIWDGSQQLVEIDRVCIQEIWKVALRQREITINRFHRELIIQAVEKLGWEVHKQQQRFGTFGHQMPIKPKELVTDDDLPF